MTASSRYAAMAPFEAACSDPYASARALSQQGRKVAGYMCRYAPLELLHAAGYLPVRIFGTTGSLGHSHAHLPSFACSVAHSALDLALAGELDFLDLMVFCHTCDTLQNLADIWRENVKTTPVLTVSTPTLLQTEASATFYRSELARIRAALADDGAELSDDRLDASWRLYEEHRRCMQKLFAVRRERPGALTGRETLVVVLASCFMAVEDHAEAAKALLAEVGAVKTTPNDARPRVYLLGSVCQSAEYLRTIEDAGLLVVDDELCTGTRFFETVPETTGSDDPLERLVHLHLNRTPCPAKHAPGVDSAADLLERVKRADAAGVVFLFTKLCDPWSFDYPELRDALDNAGVPSLLLEIEQHQPPPEQLKTRLSAFAEVVAAQQGNPAGPYP